MTVPGGTSASSVATLRVISNPLTSGSGDAASVTYLRSGTAPAGYPMTYRCHARDARSRGVSAVITATIATSIARRPHLDRAIAPHEDQSPQLSTASKAAAMTNGRNGK